MKDKILGRTLGGYKIVKPLGMGGMATVYKAFDPQTERHVAVKILPEYYAQYPEFKIRFEREAKSIAQLEHLHILPIFAYGEEDDITYIIMRYLDGGTLTKHIRKHKGLPFIEAHRILMQIASALDYAHDFGILHRDVKPTNILIDNQKNAILTDFGVAKILESDHPDLTATGGIVGTPKYMSPEQCQGKKDLTPASDQYSLGIVLYEMVTGDVPFNADTPLAIIQQHLSAPLPFPHEARPDLSSAAEGVIIRALARSPQHRYASCLAMAEAFGVALTNPEQSSSAKKLILNDTQPSTPHTLAGQTLAGNTLARAKHTPILAPTTPPISHPIPSQINLAQPKTTPLIWIVGLLIVALLVGGSAYAGFRLLGDESIPSNNNLPSSVMPIYKTGDILFSADSNNLLVQAFVESNRFWETIESKEALGYRTSGTATQDIIYLGEADWADYQLNLHFMPTSAFAVDILIPLVEMRLDAGENDAYVLAYQADNEHGTVYLIRQTDCKDVSTCDILGTREVPIIEAGQWLDIELSAYNDTLTLKWGNDTDAPLLTVTDETPLLAGQIGLIIPSRQVFVYEQVGVVELVADTE